MTTPHKTGRVFSLLGKGLFMALTVCCLTNGACPQVSSSRSESQPGLSQRDPPSRTSQGNDSGPRYEVTSRQLDLIAPGTVIDQGPPKGWSHLVIKSNPRIGAGDLKVVTKHTAQLSSLLYTAILADAQTEKSAIPVRHRLDKVAVGLGTKVDGKDVIVSPETQRELGANLGILERTVLSKAQEKLQDVQVVVRSATMALIDAPNLLQRDGKHCPVVLRYALLVDAATGRLQTLLWVIDRDERGGYQGVAGPAEWLPANKMEDCVLHVNGKEFSFGVPSDRAFALNRVPQGQKQVDLPDDLKPLAARMRFTSDMAYQLEKKLREMMKK